MSGSNNHNYIGKKIRPWEVDRIVDKKLVGGRVRYLVKWRRFNELNTWEISESFADPSILEKFEREWQISQRTVRHPLVRLSTERIVRNLLPKFESNVTEKIGKTNGKKSPCPATSVDKTSHDDTLLKDVINLMETELQCSICLDVYKKPCLTDCEHIFCDQCIEMWMKNQNSTCPICRAVLHRSQKKLTKIDNFIVKVNELSRTFK